MSVLSVKVRKRRADSQPASQPAQLSFCFIVDGGLFVLPFLLPKSDVRERPF